MTKQEEVWKLVEQIGLENATPKQQVEDAEKVAHYEAWFKSQVLGRKSSYQEE